MITIHVDGDPVGQGALRSNGHGHLYESTKGHKPWRDSVIYAASEAFGGGDVLLGPVGLTCVFTFRYLRSHYTASGAIKASAPVYKSTKPDLDHLQRSIGDALVLAGCMRDDAQIVHWDVVKQYGLRAGVVIKLRSLDGVER